MFWNDDDGHYDSMEGGELFQRIQDRQDEGPFTERGKNNFFFVMNIPNEKPNPKNLMKMFFARLQKRLKLCMKYVWL